MSEQIKVITFGDLMERGVLEIGDGYRAKLEELGGDDGPFFLRAGLLVELGFDWASAERFRDDVLLKVRSKLGQPGDTMVTTKGNSVGRAAYVPPGAPEFVYSPHLSYWRSVDSSRLSPGFLRYWSRSPWFSARLGSMAHGTDMAPYVSLADQRRLRISLPPIFIQEAIAEVLESLDNKIAVNENITRTCDQLRAANLHCWIKSNPGMVKGCPLSSVAKFVNGRPFTKDATGAGRVVIRISEINSGPGLSTVRNDIEVPSAHLARPGDVLFAWSGSLVVARWFRPEGIINQHIFKVIPNTGIPVWLVFELVNTKLAVFKSIAAGKATTMGHIQRQHLDELVDVPVRESIPELDDALQPLWDRALTAEQESLKLAELRDTLLPRLMSGEIQVRDAGKAVEEVT